MGLMDSPKIYIESQMKGLKAAAGKNKRLVRPFVTISREAGSYGTPLAKALVEYLSQHERRKQCPWTVFDKELLDRVLEDHHLSEEFRSLFAESTVSELEDILKDLISLYPSQHILARRMSETILNLAEIGYAVIVGRGGNVITSRLSGGVHVRLIGSLNKRVAYTQEYLGLDKAKAKAYVLKKDKDRSDYVRKYFDKKIDDPLMYDVLINTDHVPLHEAVRMIAHMVLKY